ncbi:MAG: TetR/AcrR family transcriptional regulator [Chloroflexi bacterium]|nr:TetR/AcrR family transcriptional regulator [Chloroflexota bacterium]MYK62236.1 TetR/AcrR family transcriptional regulator [Chloroflexota bacterium]
MTQTNPQVTQQDPKPGRPRDPNLDRAILRATIQVLTDVGYAAMSVERVANIAGVGKTTIYRRYENKEELTAAAMRSLTDNFGPPPDTGSARDDIIEMLIQNLTALERGPGFSVMGALLVEERRNPALLELFRNRIMQPRREDAVAVLQRGVERGEIRPETDLETAVYAMVGSILARHILGAPQTRTQIENTVDTIFQGISTTNHITPSSGGG